LEKLVNETSKELEEKENNEHKLVADRQKRAQEEADQKAS